MQEFAFMHRHCLRKKMYHEEGQAERHAKKMRAKGIDIYPYWCKICGKWHNGHRKEKVSN